MIKNKSIVRFIVYEDYEESKLMSELQELDKDVELSQITEDTVEIKTVEPDKVSDRLSLKTLTYVSR